MTTTEIDSIRWSLLKFRNVFFSDDMSAGLFLYFASRLQRDINDKTLDPYPYKYAVQPPKV